MTSASVMPVQAGIRSWSGWVLGFAALTANLLGLWIAAHHPLVPGLVVAAFVVWAVVAFRYRSLWLFVLPATMPAINFAPWTGWIAFDEVDLVVLGAIAGGYARLAWRGGEGASPLSARGRVAVAVLAGLALLSVGRGIGDAGAWSFGWFQGHAEPLNAWRVGKSALYALLLLPLVRRDARSPQAGGRFACGMLAGAVVVSMAALWERAAYPGLFDFTEIYRTTALFWEMHVGGAAIDAYLALATPYVAWALWVARSRLQWAAAAVLALVWAYVCLTTFARGVYLGVVVSLLLLAGWRLLGGIGWRRAASALLALALVAEVAVVIGAGSFMSSRLSDSERDYQSRTAHWARGIGLLQGPAHWLLGLGAGRLPAHYDRQVAGAQFPGQVRWVEGSVQLHGPRSMPALGGLYGLTQRVPVRTSYRVAFDARVERSTRLEVRVCEVHLLYERACQGAWLALRPRAGADPWQRVSLALEGPPLTTGSSLVPRRAALVLTVLDAGGIVAMDRIELQAPGEGSLLRNGDFAQGLAHWLPVAQYYFIPWHIDNLYLELLIERGLVGLAAFLAIVVLLALRLPPRNAAPALAPFVAASLAGVLAVGLVSSVLDVPRVALLMFLSMALLWQLQGRAPVRSRGSA